MLRAEELSVKAVPVQQVFSRTTAHTIYDAQILPEWQNVSLYVHSPEKPGGTIET